MKFYRIPPNAFRARGARTLDAGSLDGVELHTTGAWVYLHAAPTPQKEAQLLAEGAELIGETWTELKASLTSAQRGKIFAMEVQRGGVIHFIRRGSKKAGDVVLSDWLPPHVFHGEPDPDPVP